jgi:hypothetical protein
VAAGAAVVPAGAAVVAAAAAVVGAAEAAAEVVVTALLDPQLASVRSRPQLNAEAREIFMALRLEGRGRIVGCKRKEFRVCFSTVSRPSDGRQM